MISADTSNTGNTGNTSNTNAAGTVEAELGTASSGTGTKLHAILGGTTALALLVGLGAALLYAPTDLVQGNAQRIFYFHVPLAWTAYLAFFIVLVGSVGYLWKRDVRWDRLAACSAEIGLVLTTLVLVTGSLWGKTVWGTWWSWDPRLTATLVLWFVYLGYGMVRQFTSSPERARRISAVLGIVGFIDVPIVHQSVVWWRSLHPEPIVLNSSGPQLPGTMLLALMINLLAFTLLYAYLLAQRTHVAGLEGTLADRKRQATLLEA